VAGRRSNTKVGSTVLPLFVSKLIMSQSLYSSFLGIHISPSLPYYFNCIVGREQFIRFNQRRVSRYTSILKDLSWPGFLIPTTYTRGRPGNLRYITIIKIPGRYGKINVVT
jgi:hypothetical protein